MQGELAQIRHAGVLVVDHEARRAELVDAAWRVIAAEGLEPAAFTDARLRRAAGAIVSSVL